MIENMTISHFEPLIGQTFEVCPADMAPVTITLVEVSDQSGSDFESFSLLFQGPNDTIFQHDTHLIKHSELGDFHLFLGPVASEEISLTSYQAIFNRPKND